METSLCLCCLVSQCAGICASWKAGRASFHPLDPHHIEILPRKTCTVRQFHFLLIRRRSSPIHATRGCLVTQRSNNLGDLKTTDEKPTLAYCSHKSIKTRINQNHPKHKASIEPRSNTMLYSIASDGHLTLVIKHMALQFWVERILMYVMFLTLK